MGVISSIFVYYESMERKLLKPTADRFHRNRRVVVPPTWKWEVFASGRPHRTGCNRTTPSVVELEHLKIKTRLTNEKFVSVKGECEI